MLLALFAVSCGGTASTGGSVDRLRERLETTRCRNRMDSLAFEMQGLLLDVESPDAEALDSIASTMGDSLTSCPSSELPYSLSLDDGRITVTCPDGHGGRSAGLR